MVLYDVSATGQIKRGMRIREKDDGDADSNDAGDAIGDIKGQVSVSCKLCIYCTHQFLHLVNTLDIKDNKQACT